MSLPSVRKELELDVTDEPIRGSWPRRMKAKVMELALEAQDRPGNDDLLIANNGAAKLVRCNRRGLPQKNGIIFLEVFFHNCKPPPPLCVSMLFYSVCSNVSY
jgi:hypothetical protein